MARSNIEISTVNGVQILKSGSEGPNIVFLHNSGQVPLGMTEHIDLLSEAGQVVAPNLFDLIRILQLGGNKKPTPEDIVDVFVHLDILDRRQKTGLVTSSMGSFAAWEYSARKPQNADWIVAGSPIGWPLKRTFIEWVGAFVREFVLPPKTKVPDQLKQRDPGPGYFIKRLKEHPGSILWGWKISMDADQRDQMKGITQPVDLLWGRTDNYIPIWAG